jgi:hypothetical protein
MAGALSTFEMLKSPGAPLTSGAIISPSMMADFVGGEAAASTIGAYLSDQSVPRREKALMPPVDDELGPIAIVLISWIQSSPSGGSSTKIGNIGVMNFKRISHSDRTPFNSFQQHRFQA